MYRLIPGAHVVPSTFRQNFTRKWWVPGHLLCLQKLAGDGHSHRELLCYDEISEVNLQDILLFLIRFLVLASCWPPLS